MAYEQQAGRANVESAAINYLTDGDKKKKKKEGKSSTTTTSKTGVTNPDFPDSKRKGTLYTDTVTTTIDGTSGKKTPGKPGQPFNNPAMPNQTYKEFMNAPEGSPGKPVKPTKTPDTPGSSSSVSTTRFKPDDIPAVTKMKPYGIKTQTPEIKAPAIGAKPFSDLVAISTSRGGGGHKPGDSNRPRREMGTLVGGGLRERTMEETVATRSEATRLKALVRYNNNELNERYSAKNITKNLKGKVNEKGLANALEKGKNLIANNLSTVDSFRDVYDAEASTMIGSRTRVNNKNRPANQAAEKAKRIAKKKNLDTAKATKTAAVAKNRASTTATKRAAIDKKNKERAAKIAARKKN